MKAKLALILWSSLIAVFSLVPMESSGPELFPHEDKLVHLLCYAILTLLMCRVADSIVSGSKYILLALMFSISYGIIMECLQASLNTGRHFDYFDIIANIIGSLTGSLMYYLLRKK